MQELKDLQSDVRSAGRTSQPPAGAGKRKKKIVVEEASEEAGEDGPAVAVPSHPLSAQYEPEGEWANYHEHWTVLRLGHCSEYQIRKEYSKSK